MKRRRTSNGKSRREGSRGMEKQRWCGGEEGQEGCSAFSCRALRVVWHRVCVFLVVRLPRALLSAQVRARNALQSAFLHSESLLTQLLNREGGLSQVIRMQARHKHEPLDCSAGCLTCSTFLGDAEFKMPPWLKGGRQRGHLDLEMEPGSLQRSSPHRNWRHRLDPDIYMLQSCP